MAYAQPVRLSTKSHRARKAARAGTSGSALIDVLASLHPVQHVRAGLLHGVMAAQQGERLGQQGLVGQVGLAEQPAQPGVGRGLHRPGLATERSA